MHEQPEVSLYIPCYNATAYLEPVLRAALKQTLPPAEIFIVDDGSTDDTVGLAERLGVRVVRHPENRGLAAARNSAVMAATSPYLASLDADVVAPPDWLALLAENVARGAFAGACGTLVETQIHTLADRWRASHLVQSWGEERNENPQFLFGNNNIFRRAALLEVGLYDVSCRTNGEDYDISRRLREAGHKLVYDPRARCQHLRRDGIKSICRTAYRYNHHKEKPATLRNLRRRRRRGRRIVSSFLARDIRHGRWSLALLDLLMHFEWAAHDWRRLLQRGG